MALAKRIADPQAPGEIDSYAKYGLLVINTREHRVDLELDVYRSEEARAAIKEDGSPMYDPAAVERYRITDDGATGPDGPLPDAPRYADYMAGDNADPNGTGAQVYGFLKTFTGWVGAADV